MVRKTSTVSPKALTQDSAKDPARFEGGPIFLPPRQPSAWAQALMTSLAQGLGERQSVTGYDEIWYGNRPQTS